MNAPRGVATDPGPGRPRILLVAYYFPPQGGGGVQRPAKMVKAWHREGVPVSVLAGPMSSTANVDRTLLAGLPEGVVHRVPDPGPYRLVQACREALPGNALFRPFDRALVAAGAVARALSVPDVTAGFVLTAVARGLSLARKFRPDVIVPTGPPFSTFVAGTLLARMLGKPLVLDYRDPWSENYLLLDTTAMMRRVNPSLERWVLRRAQGMATAHRAVFRWLEPLLPEREPRRIWVPNGYDPEDFAEPDAEGPRPDRFELSYAGSFYSTRNPKHLFRALDDLLAAGRLDPAWFRFRIAGGSAQVLKPYDPEGRLERVVRFDGYVSHRETVRRLQRSTVNLVLEGEMRGSNQHSPGKFYEVLYACRPVLLICPEGTTTILGRRARGCWITHPEDEEGIKRKLMEMVEAWQAGTLSGPDPERFRFYDRTLQARRMLRFLESVVGAERPAVDRGAVDRRLAPGARRGEC